MPTLLVHNGKIIRKNLDKELLSVHELKAILRRQGIHDLGEVHAAILESNGFVSVTKMGENQSAPPTTNSGGCSVLGGMSS